MIPIDVLGTFFATAIILGLVPGPDNLFVLTQAAAKGRVSGIIVTFGLLTGLLVHTMAVALGISVIFKTSPLAFTILKIFGVGYLLYLAYGSFRAGKENIEKRNKKPVSLMTLYRRGIIMNISNPKISIFFLAFLPQFADPSRGEVSIQIAVLGIVFIIATLIIFALISFLAGSIGDYLKNSDKAQTYLNRIAGVVFIGLAAKLAFSNHNSL
ncbi:MAG: LysE family translocator [Emcibacteraceae bacterium]|nr:LysE family translocator [Emcibacteraceae bacterium]